MRKMRLKTVEGGTVTCLVPERPRDANAAFKALAAGAGLGFRAETGPDEENVIKK